MSVERTMSGGSKRLRSSIALLLLASAVLFAVGTSLERSAWGEGSETAALTASGDTEGHSEAEERVEREAEGHSEAEESAEQRAAEGRVETSSTTDADGGAGHSEADEQVLSINPEFSGAGAAVVVVSLVLAAAVWLWGNPAVLMVVIAFSLLSAAFDVREAFFLARAATGLLTGIAALIAVLHLGVVALAVWALMNRSGSPSAVLR